MDIAALSMSLSSAKVQMSASVSVSKKIMDQQEVQAEGLMKLMENSSVPAAPSEHIIDVKA